MHPGTTIDTAETDSIQIGAQAQLSNWYAVHTRARHEKTVAHKLNRRGLSTFLPLTTEVHRWSDRNKKVQVPLFPCYIFAKLAPTNEDRVYVLQEEGVFRIVGPRGEGSPIPDEQITTIQHVVANHVPVFPYPILQLGQRVRIRSGAMAGVEGVLASRNGNRSLVLSIDAIQRSIALQIEGYDLEVVQQPLRNDAKTRTRIA
jgi:transcription antitermination factor NusG